MRHQALQTIEEQLRTLLLGLSYDEISKVILVYRAPWIDHLAPKLFKAEFESIQKGVLKTLIALFGKETASHIPLLTNLPPYSEDFSQIPNELPPSGYFFELRGAILC